MSINHEDGHMCSSLASESLVSDMERLDAISVHSDSRGFPPRENTDCRCFSREGLVSPSWLGVGN